MDEKRGDGDSVNMVDDEEAEAASQVAEYPVGTYVVLRADEEQEANECRAHPGRTTQRFWIAEVSEDYGTGPHRAQIKVCWYDAREEFGSYAPQFLPNRTHKADWVDKLDVLTSVRVGRTGKIYQKDRQAVQCALALLQRRLDRGDDVHGSDEEDNCTPMVMDE